MIGCGIFNRFNLCCSKLVFMNSSALLSLSLAFAFLSFIALLPQNIFAESRPDFSPNQTIRISIPQVLCLPLREKSLLVTTI